MAADVTKRHTYHVLELHCANSTVGQEYGRAYAPAAAARQLQHHTARDRRLTGFDFEN